LQEEEKLMTYSDDPLATRVFRDRESAEKEYQQLLGRGYTSNDINLFMTEAARKRHFGETTVTKTELGNKALEGAGIGGGIGAVAGGALAAIVMASTVAVPGLGLLVAGPLAAALAGAGAGAVAGGTIGGLVGLGIPEERVKKYETTLNQGGILMGVKPRKAEDRTYFEKEWDLDRQEAPVNARRGY
jgi:hypothetical protein